MNKSSIAWLLLNTVMDFVWRITTGSGSSAAKAAIASLQAPLDIWNSQQKMAAQTASAIAYMAENGIGPSSIS